MPALYLLDLFDNPPLIPTQSGGKETDLSQRPSIDCAEPDQERRSAPMCDVKRDYQLCYNLLLFVRNHLKACNEDITFENDIYTVHHATDRALSRTRLGEDTYNADAFAFIANYVSEFVAVADDRVGGLGIRTSCCPGGYEGSCFALVIEGAPRCRVIRRGGKAWVHVQFMDEHRFDKDWEDIWKRMVLAGDMKEKRSEITRHLGNCIMKTTCPWAIILAGSKYVVFHLQDVMIQGTWIRRLTMSDCHAIASSPLGPSLASVLIAQLLPDDAAVRHIPLSIACHEKSVLREALDSMQKRTRELQRSPPPSPTPSWASSSSETVKSESDTRNYVRSMARPPERDLLAVFNRISHCKMRFPRSLFPGRSTLLTKVTSESVLEGALNPLRTAVLNEEQYQHVGLEVVGSVRETYHSISLGWFIVDGRDIPCAVKFEQSCEVERFRLFQNEVNVYERLRGHRFMPTFYAAFAAMTLGGPMGVLVTEMAHGVLPPFDEMDEDEKHAVLRCTKELHRAGYHNDDHRSEIFGVRDSGEVIIVDFSEATPIDPSENGRCQSRLDVTCRDIRWFRKQLFGSEEMTERERREEGESKRRRLAEYLSS